MKDRLIKAVQDAIILGVKYAIVLAIVAFVARDYMQTRQNALFGNATRVYVESLIQAGKLPRPENVSAPAPVPAATPVVK